MEFCYTSDDNFTARLKLSVKRANRWIRDYLFCFLTLILFVLFLKFFYGEHRPHFLSLCQPDLANCTVGSLVKNYSCTNQNISRFKLIDISNSFPSGHSALAAHFSVFLVWYLHKRIGKLKSRYLIPFMQAILIIYAAFVGATRITDNAHHKSDVAFGTLFGFIFSIQSVRFRQL